MKIGIIGAGNVGTGIAKNLVPKGHKIMFSYSRDSEKLAETAIQYDSTYGTPSEAAAFADVVVIATPWASTEEALKQIGNAADGKIVWDCTNALKPDLSGLEIGTTTSAGEEIQKNLSKSIVIKAIPPFASIMHGAPSSMNGHHSSVFVCGSDANAKEKIMHLVSELGAMPVDAGPLKNSRYTEPAGFLMVQLAYALGHGEHIGMEIFGLKSLVTQSA
jgi:predicted dinucleotide-binding enzyme